MIISVTLNPCIDKTIYLDHLQTGGANRVSNARVDLSGKGLNVSTILTRFNEKTKCLGFNFRGNARILERILDERGVVHDFIMVDGEIRTNIKLFDKSCQIMTEVNELGHFVPPGHVDKLIDKIDSLLDQTHILVLSGSIPPGVPVDVYKRIILMAKRKDVKTVLDTSGEPFLLGLEAKPDMIKPNRFEFEQAFAEEFKAGKSYIEIAREVVAGGIPYVCISLGADGAILVDKDHVYSAKALPVEAKGLTGAGDSVVAGLCYALQNHMSTEDMLRYGMAASAGSVRLEGTLLTSKNDLEELLPQVVVDIVS